MAAASAGPYANHLHLTPDLFSSEDNHTSNSSLNFFHSWILFLMPNQQCQSTEVEGTADDNGRSNTSDICADDFQKLLQFNAR